MNATPQNLTRPNPLTAGQTSALAFRLRRLGRFDQYRQEGFSKEAAAKKAGVSPATLWRWQTALEKHGEAGLIPGISPGRKSAAAAFMIALEIIAAVERLQLGGRGNAAGWLAFAEDPKCPPALAAFLRTAKTMPPSFLSATRLKKSTARVVEGHNFSHISRLAA